MSDGPTRDDFIRITNREIYDGLRGVQDELFQLKTTVNVVLSDNQTLGKRIRALELRFYGVVAGLMAAVAVIGQGYL